MQNVLVPRHVSRSASDCGRLAPNPPGKWAIPSPKPDREGLADQQFMTMLDAYRPSGGLASGPEVFALFARRCGADVGTLAGWIVNRKVICFEWQSRMWLPLFQFQIESMTTQPGLREVLEALTPDHDPWEMAQWFSRAHPLLVQQMPCDALGQDPAGVRKAAGAALSLLAH